MITKYTEEDNKAPEQNPDHATMWSDRQSTFTKL